MRTWAHNGRVPAREIRLRKGQTLRATVTNKLPDPTTVHWHGLAIPNPMDGVPVLTQPAIASGQSFTYEFEPPDSGTYWLHSHVGTQLDRGLYGPLIIEDPNEKADWDDELVVALDDWIDSTGTNPDQVLENLKKNGMAKMGPAEAGAGVTRRHLWVMTAATLPTRTTWSTVGSPRTRKWSITGPERVFGFGLSTPPPTPRSVSRCPARR